MSSRPRPAWSGALTAPLGRLVPAEHRAAALLTVKGVHTGLFISIGAAVLVTLWDGLRQRPRRRTAVAGALVLVESAVYVSNNQVCPLTPLAEELGAERGSVVDMFLPAAVARRIPLVAGTAAVAAAVLNAVALVDRRR